MSLKLKVYDVKGSASGDVSVPDGFLNVKNGRQAVQDAVTVHLARRRAGTASTLSKSHVAGSNKKPWRQKGTGRARAGYRQSPVWRGGAVAFGPHPRSYDRKLNKKVMRLAFRRAFADKLNAGEVMLVDNIELGSAKTKEFSGVLNALKAKKPVLVLLGKPDKAVDLASRNMKGVEIALARDAGVFEILKCAQVVITSEGWEIVKGRLSTDSKSKKSDDRKESK